MFFTKALAWSKLQTALSRVWTQLIKYISYNDNRFISSAYIQITVQESKLYHFLYQKNKSKFYTFILIKKVTKLLLKNIIKKRAKNMVTAADNAKKVLCNRNFKLI